MGFPSFTDVLAGLSVKAAVRGAQLAPTVAAAIDSAGDLSRTVLGTFDAAAGTDLVGWAHDRSARDRGDAGRAGLDSVYGSFAGDFTGDFEPAMSVEDSFDAMSHAEIKEYVEAMQPSRMQESVDGWTRAQGDLDDHLEVFRGALATVFSEHWTGDTAGSAGRGVADYSSSLTQLTSALGLVTNSLGYASVGIEQVKQMLPEPPSRTWMDAIRAASTGVKVITAGPSVGADLVRLFHEEEEARASAVRIMKDDYAPTVTRSDSRVPVLPQAYDPTTGGDSGNASGYPGGATGAGSSGTGRGTGSAGGSGWSAAVDRGSGGDGAATADDPDAAGLGAAAPGSPGSGTQGSGSQSESGSAGSPSTGVGGSDSARTTAASTGPGGATPGSGALPSGTSPGSGGSFGGAGSGSGPGSPGSSGAIPPGFVPGGAAAAPAAGAAANAARGLGRMSPMPMGMMPQGNRGDEEAKRSVPGYLVTEDHGNELIGDLPATIPPVLGA